MGDNELMLHRASQLEEATVVEEQENAWFLAYFEKEDRLEKLRHTNIWLQELCNARGAWGVQGKGVTVPQDSSDYAEDIQGLQDFLLYHEAENATLRNEIVELSQLCADRRQLVLREMRNCMRRQ